MSNCFLANRQINSHNDYHVNGVWLTPRMWLPSFHGTVPIARFSCDFMWGVTITLRATAPTLLSGDSAISEPTKLDVNITSSICVCYWCRLFCADLIGSAVWGVGLRSLVSWHWGLKRRRGHGCLSFVSVVLPGRSLGVGLIIRLEEFYRVLCLWSWSVDNEEALNH
jgi:hypothetical protein